MCRCLYCYKELDEGQKDFHPACVKKFFGTNEIPMLDYRHEDLDRLAEQVIRAQTSLTGVQPKLSLNLNKHEGCSRLTIVGLWGDYIFKPQNEAFSELPENEDLTMHLAEAARISVVPHSLMRLADGKLGYITKRIDRTASGEKIAMEDFCLLVLRVTADKYKGSYERCGKIVKEYAENPGLDMTELFLRIVFSFAVGNSDMHLKNFSLIETAPGNGIYRLSEAYDMLPVNIILPADKDQMALTLNGKNRNLRRSDFLTLAENCGLNRKSAEKMLDEIAAMKDAYLTLCKDSFLPGDYQEALCNLIDTRIRALQ